MTRTFPVFIVSASFVLGACATNGNDGTYSAGDTRNMGEALATPVNDVGLDDIEIPTYLSNMNDPYADAPGNCAAAKAEVDKLNEMLGSDLDVPEDEDERRERVALNATSSAIGSIIIPFRGVVRAISGAASNERRAREAYQRGLVRRAYVKGLYNSDDCKL